MKISPGEVQAFVDVYSAFVKGERQVQGRPALQMLVGIYDCLDKLTRPAQSADGQPARAPNPSGGELELTAAQVEVIFHVASAGLAETPRLCDARRALAAFTLLDRMNAEVERDA